MVTQNPSLRQRMREYRQFDEYPNTPDGHEVPRWKQAAGLVLVPTVGFVATAPIALLMLAAYRLQPHPAFGVAALALLPIAMTVTKFVGAPVADHVLDIPREVSD